MTNAINAYAADTAGGPLKPFSFDPGELGPEEVEIKVSHCGICHSDPWSKICSWFTYREPVSNRPDAGVQRASFHRSDYRDIPYG